MRIMAIEGMMVMLCSAFCGGDHRQAAL